MRTQCSRKRPRLRAFSGKWMGGELSMVSPELPVYYISLTVHMRGYTDEMA